MIQGSQCYMRIPENAISTKQKKRRKNPLQNIPGGFFIALLLFSIWGGGALLGVWIQSTYPPSGLSNASTNPTKETTQASVETEVLLVEPQTRLEDFVSFVPGASEPLFITDELMAFVSGLDLNRTYLVSACYLGTDGGGVFSSLAFARAAEVAASIKTLEPQLNLQVQAQSECEFERLEVNQMQLTPDDQQLAMRINLPLEPINLDERLFFEKAYNRVLRGGQKLLLVDHSKGDLAENLVERLVDQGFASKHILLLKPALEDSVNTESSDYLTAYMVPEAPIS